MNTYFLRKSIRKNSKSLVRKKCFREYKNIHRVLILFDLENAECVKDFAKSLLFAGKEVFAYSFDASKRGACPVLPDHFHVWNKSHLTLAGIPHQKSLEDFLSEHPDTIVDLCVNPHPVLQYLSLKTGADYRVGFHLENQSFGDLLIEYNTEQGFVFLTSQLHFYMKSLHTK
jgi:hypothetical protein